MQEPAERMREITGGPERLPGLSAEHLDARHHAAIDRLGVLYPDGTGEPLDSFYAMLAHSPDLFAGFMDLGVAIALNCALPARWREMLILRTGWLCGAPYQWGEHVLAARRAGLRDDEIERVTLGAAADGWNACERALLRAAEQLHARAMIDDETWEDLARFLDERQLLEVPLVVGHYHTTAFVQNALRARLTDYNPGLSAR
ncbi:carboxymuconolactone decarboxylase family protein [Novosphingobium sp. RD2P27]|uniref:Carboxymuconolactone decarboxylase family protein n=1 Tax=Novosphingobium kalidii TaxID=3230299 RepID=A0ABV2D5N9_9SPHN